MFIRIIIGVVLGGALGFGYYRWFGCASGTCPLFSNPYSSTFYGMILGGLLAVNHGSG
jgi:hypothetical protein